MGVPREKSRFGTVGFLGDDRVYSLALDRLPFQKTNKQMQFERHVPVYYYYYLTRASTGIITHLDSKHHRPSRAPASSFTLHSHHLLPSPMVAAL